MTAKKGQEVIAGLVGTLVAVIIQFLLFSFYAPTWIAEVGGDPLARLLGNLQIIPILNQLRGSILVLLYPVYGILFSVLNAIPHGSTLPPIITSLLVAQGLDNIPLTAINISLMDFLIYWALPILIAALVTAVVAQEKSRALLLPEGLLVLLLVFTIIIEAMAGTIVNSYGGILNLNEILLSMYIYNFGALTDPSSVINLVNSISSASIPQNLLLAAPYTLTFLITSAVAIGILAEPFTLIAKHVWKTDDTSIPVISSPVKNGKTNNHKNKIPKSVVIPSVTPPPVKKKPSPPPPKKKKPVETSPSPPEPKPKTTPPERPELDLPSQDDAPKPSPASQPSKFCANCGAPLEENATYCEKCGW
jgi:hypothetical protein